MVQWSSGRQRSLNPSSSPAGAERWPRCPIWAPTSPRSCSGTSAAAGSGSASSPPPRLGRGVSFLPRRCRCSLSTGIVLISSLCSRSERRCALFLISFSDVCCRRDKFTVNLHLFLRRTKGGQ